MTIDVQWVDKAWEDVVKKIGRTSKRIGTTFPHVSHDGRYNAVDVNSWANGFWPGLLWLIYRENSDTDLCKLAIECEEQLDEKLHGFYELDHDSGFIWTLSSRAHYMLLKNEESKLRALTAASHLAGRFNVQGKFIRAWNDEEKEGWAIVESLMNLPLLYWASEMMSDPRFAYIAMVHADTILREFIRPDGSCYHIINFDPDTGEKIETLAGRGFSPESSWSRGTAWALYGLVLSYRYTSEVKYLEAAKKVAGFFISKLPDDFVPYWDLKAPVEEDMPIDSSAAAIAASGIIEISRCVEPPEKDFYYDNAVMIVKSLYENYGAWNREEEALITKATQSYPAYVHIHVPVIYGDYFFVEALSKLRGREEIFW